VKINPYELPHLVVGTCMEVHRALGPGLPAVVYSDCLAVEFRMREMMYRRNVALPFRYKGTLMEPGIPVDFLVEEALVVSVVSMPAGELPDHERLQNLLRLSGFEVGLLVNFNVTNFRDGVRRIIVSAEPPTLHYREDRRQPMVPPSPG
jgi:GxxExxY protein